MKTLARILIICFSILSGASSQASLPPLDPKPVVLVYVDEGKIYCDGQVLSIEALQRHILARIKVDEIETVFIRGTISEQFGEIVQVLDACRQIKGLRYVTISSQVPEVLPEHFRRIREKNEPNQRPETNAGKESVSPATPGPGVAHP